MPDVLRYRKWDNQEVVTRAIQSHLLIEVGDLVYLSLNGHVYPASSQPDQGSENANQELFACRFLGVSPDRSLVGEVLPILAYTRGEHEMIVAALAADLPLGTPMAASENAGGTALLDQTVEEADNDTEKIGRLSRAAAAGDTSVFMKVESAIMDGRAGDTCDSSSSTAV